MPSNFDLSDVQKVMIQLSYSSGHMMSAVFSHRISHTAPATFTCFVLSE